MAHEMSVGVEEIVKDVADSAHVAQFVEFIRRNIAIEFGRGIATGRSDADDDGVKRAGEIKDFLESAAFYQRTLGGRAVDNRGSGDKKKAGAAT